MPLKTLIKNYLHLYIRSCAHISKGFSSKRLKPPSQLKKENFRLCSYKYKNSNYCIQSILFLNKITNHS